MACVQMIPLARLRCQSGSVFLIYAFFSQSRLRHFLQLQHPVFSGMAFLNASWASRPARCSSWPHMAPAEHVRVFRCPVVHLAPSRRLLGSPAREAGGPQLASRPHRSVYGRSAQMCSDFSEGWLTQSLRLILLARVENWLSVSLGQ